MRDCRFGRTPGEYECTDPAYVTGEAGGGEAGAPGASSETHPAHMPWRTRLLAAAPSHAAGAGGQAASG